MSHILMFVLAWLFVLFCALCLVKAGDDPSDWLDGPIEDRPIDATKWEPNRLHRR